jgi:hypothetical protein
MDITKPIDSHRAEAGGSWLDWIRIPSPKSMVRNKLDPQTMASESGAGTIEAWRTKQAGRRGEVYVPEPTAQDPRYAPELESTGGKISVDDPKYNPDREAPQTDVPVAPYLTPEDDVDKPPPGGPGDAAILGSTGDKELPPPGPPTKILPPLRSTGEQKNKASGKRISASGEEEVPWD